MELHLDDRNANSKLVQSYVTLFATELPLDRRFLNLSMQGWLPKDYWPLLTTSASAQDLDLISVTRKHLWYRDTACWDINPDGTSDCDVFIDSDVYRVQTRSRLSDAYIARMVGRELADGAELDSVGVTWVHRQAWNSQGYDPEAAPPGDMELADNLFYLGAAGQVLDTLEMGCRMGRNVAGLVQETYLGAR